MADVTEPAIPAAPPGPPSTTTTSSRGFRIPEAGALVVFLVALCVFFSVKSQYFLNYDNFLNILTAAAITGIIACPATMLLVAGQFDLSVGSGLTFCGIVMAYVSDGRSLWLGVLAAVAAGLGLGIINGFLVNVIGINALITTLGTLAVFSGLAKVLAGGQTLPITGFSTLGTSRPIFDIPLPVIIFAVVVVVFFLIMRYSVYGRAMYAIGANPSAARLAGIRTRTLIFIGFVLSGAFVSLAALINVSQLSAASTLSGLGVELSVVTAVILGGASLAGGRGTVIGTVLGLLIIGVLNNGLILLNIDTFWQEVARGTLLVLAVSFDQLRIRLSKA
jgi:ribose transport system permease protein